MVWRTGNYTCPPVRTPPKRPDVTKDTGRRSSTDAASLESDHRLTIPVPPDSVTHTMALHTKILIGLLTGAVLGITANLTAGGSDGLERVINLFTDPLGRHG